MLTKLIFIFTLFGSAFLSFSIQPILGKMLLPVVGGAPACWIVTMAFFQLALLGGYTLSHLLRRVTPFRHGLVLLGLYGLGLLSLPARIAMVADASHGPGLAVLYLLAQTILLPFLALTATTSALLRIFSRADQPTAQDPYYLFTASNAGSLLGLFIYPLLLEPFFGLEVLTQIWLAIYCTVLLAVAFCLLLTRRHAGVFAHEPVEQFVSAETPVKAIDLCRWFSLSFAACCLSMSLSTMITTDIANFPLIWTLPLGVYLLSFIVGFARKPLLTSDTAHFMHVVAVSLTLVFLFTHVRGYGTTLSAVFSDLLLLIVYLFMICWSCHQTLAAQRPVASRLTLYYLVIALGGATAGLLNAFVLPLVLDRIIEFQVTLLLSLLLPAIWRLRVLPVAATTRKAVIRNGAFVVSLLLMCALLHVIYRTQDLPAKIIGNYTAIMRVVIVLCLFLFIARPRWLLLAGTAVIAFTIASNGSSTEIVRHRNFFGSTVVRDIAIDDVVLRTLRHGNTTHGLAEYNRSGQPTGQLQISYYIPGGPLSDVYDLVKPQRVAIMGLGTGQLACFSASDHVRPHDTYFEIDPQMIDVARHDFPYLDHCPVDDIVLGDARLEFAKQTSPYDLLILDVFSSDSIPLHIMTREAIAMYPQHLAPDGMILFHVSNRYLTLANQIAANAEALGRHAYFKAHDPRSLKMPFALASQWVAMPLDAAGGMQLVAKGWTPIDPGRTVGWTDERSSLLTALRPVAALMGGTPDPAR